MSEQNTLIDLLDESVHNLNDIKTARKGLKDVIKQISEETSADSGFVKQASKIIFKLGEGVIDKNKPLTLDPDAEEKDPVSKLMIKLAEIIQCLNQVNMLGLLKPYFDQLEADYNIKLVTVEGSELLDTDETVKDLFESSTSYLKTIKDYQDEIKDDHAPKAEEAKLVSAKDYSKVLNIYSKGVEKGIDSVEDKCQDTLTNCEESKQSIDLLETAVNMIHDKLEVS